MKARLNCITIAVDALDRAQHFYEMIFDEKAAEVSDDLVLFSIDKHLSLVLATRSDFDSYEAITGQTNAAPGTSECIMSLFLENEAAVDHLLEIAHTAGGTIAGPASTYGWGYAGYFRDPDGHQWECVFNEQVWQDMQAG
ncbi:VOC family protein [Taibaiella koreensis]|uniref:VOC family protein n=1 Tax=Taibaiella koreensis TaxID=1268548 RepID=UPI000E5A0822|nr:VOC family protein [Taibaiella koreensis]